MVKVEDLCRAVVIGTGLMGPGIAYTLAMAGCRVKIFGRTRESADRGMRSVTAAVNLLVEGDCITDEEGASVLKQVSQTTNLEGAVADADLVTESIVEDLEIKQDLFARVERMCPGHTLLTSNTSGLPCIQLASVLDRPQRFAVTHYWNPPHLMPLVEVVKGEKTSQETMNALLALLRKAGKKPVAILRDTPGQLGNRLFHALIREAFYIVQEGIASAKDVDTAISTGLGRRLPVYGVLQHMDLVGLDMVLAIQSYMCRALCNDTEPAQLLRDKVADGELGVKSGRGIYDWSERDVGEVVRRRDIFLLELLKSEMSADADSY